MGKTSKPVNAIAMLMDDHKRVKELFNEFARVEALPYARYDELKQDLMDAVCSELKVHTRLEEEIFYPAVRVALAEGYGDEIAHEAEVEHATAKALIYQIEKSASSDPMICARFKSLGEYIAHHVYEEETEMFPAIRQSGIDLHALGMKMARRKEELVFELAEQQFEAELPPVPGLSLWDRIKGIPQAVGMGLGARA